MEEGPETKNEVASTVSLDETGEVLKMNATAPFQAEGTGGQRRLDVGDSLERMAFMNSCR